VAAEAAGKAEIVITMLPDTPDVEQVLFGKEGVAEGLRPGKLVIDMSSISPTDTKRFAKRINELGCDYLDAPVSGGEVGAKAATLTIMVGGTEKAFERARPLLEAIAKGVIHTGGIGTGSIAKIMHNCASFTLDMLMAECWTTGVKAGIDATTIVEVFNEAALGQMMSLKVRLPATYLKGDFDPRFSLALAKKDLGLALDLARQTQTPMRFAALCEQELIEAIGRGWADRDASIALTLQEERAGVTVRLMPD